ncbi:hypothetical protein [Tenacibaculum discolor]|uniref:Bacteriocin-like protein n=1 Tax=Tenacibaculum discolor TaxID=361581 RepID=A0ABT9F532_9FLAO|nr:hypothetical protein [Tenacibaculum discolor]MDP2541830.1 hypothetical protein [Tenacibaculum discolor]
MDNIKELTFEEKVEINGGLERDYELGRAIGKRVRAGIDTVLDWWDKFKNL